MTSSTDLPAPGPARVEVADRFREPDIDRALRRVGADLAGLRDLLGSLLDGGDAYLVGSLAAALGNAGSDIDVNVVVESEGSDAPMMFFLGETIVDLQYYARATLDQRVVAAGDTVALGAGECAVGRPAPPPKARKRLSRWLTACPFDPGLPPLFDPGDVAGLHAVLVRGAVESFVLSHLVADIAEGCGQSSPVAWRRAGRALVEILTRAAGDVFLGEKWLATRAARVGLDGAMVGAGFAARSRREVATLAERLGLEPLCGHELVTWEATEAEELQIGSEAWLLQGTRLGRPEVVDVQGPGWRRMQALDAWADSAVRPSIHHDALDAAVRSCAA